MFPVEFPSRIIKRYVKKNLNILDPFCGRGTTNFAASKLGYYSTGIDSSPVATAISESKVTYVSSNKVIKEAENILNKNKNMKVPKNDFWNLAYHPEVLNQICLLREELLNKCDTPERKGLRAIILGSLHGPKLKYEQSYLSNQCPRTFAPKPKYASNFWKKRGLLPDNVDVIQVIQKRALRYFNDEIKVEGMIIKGDSRDKNLFKKINKKFDWIITSPPYFGMNTYIQDQWIRNWFVGGSHEVDYTSPDQIMHSNEEMYLEDLSSVWKNIEKVSNNGARLIIRFGDLPSKESNARDLIKRSLINTNWKNIRAYKEGLSSKGRRQSDYFLKNSSQPKQEYNVWATLKV